MQTCKIVVFYLARVLLLLNSYVFKDQMSVTNKRVVRLFVLFLDSVLIKETRSHAQPRLNLYSKSFQLAIVQKELAYGLLVVHLNILQL